MSLAPHRNTRRPLCIDLAGYGTGGRHFHSPFIAAVHGVELAGVVTRVLETKRGWVIMGFADGGKEDFDGYVMDLAPIEVGAEGHLHIGMAG